METTTLTPKEIDDPVVSREFYIFGNGISFSISPTIHNAGFKHDQLPYRYQIQESSDIDGVAHLIEREDFGGASVTMPHKLQVHKFCQQQSQTALAIGAINTLVVSGQGRNRVITGDNTDWSGLHSIIKSYKNSTGRPAETGLVLGAGGASRAALYAMHQAGLKNIYLVNRTKDVAESVREQFSDLFKITVLESAKDMPKDYDVVIGTVPAHVTTEEQFKGIFRGHGLCIDMSYKPRQTPLLAVAQRSDGWVTVPGVQVLLSQAFDQYKLWTGREAPRKAIVDAVVAKEGGDQIQKL
ncbi:hypothetical protein KC357_g6758 [Hortaea werneckii]|nr:hypothetical protein KC342_g13351 [Hortaea werneckii]KAI7071446.1 hypothetical protein KC339_g14436 [Hortaea werneckii]KAI7224699.1 hypothetical protein KC365_g10490 [Hortaea werneckii]KAI7468425.1 hypothetical protein KC357_g6758 [Hortaea werneckii]KAI7475168.1 hypothetical protein KC351_g10258 [Hortaea werneckii]